MKQTPLVLVVTLVAIGISASLGQTPNSPSAPPPPASSPPAAVSAAAARSQREQKAVATRFASGWGQKLREGGNTAIVQLLLSVFGATFIFERLFNLRRNKIAPRG